MSRKEKLDVCHFCPLGAESCVLSFFFSTASKLPKGVADVRPTLDGPSPQKVQRTARSQTVSNGVPGGQEPINPSAGSNIPDLTSQRSRPPIPKFSTGPSSSSFKSLPPSPSPSKKRSREPESTNFIFQPSNPEDLSTILETRAAVRGRDVENFRPRPWLRPLKLQSSRSSTNLSSSNLHHSLKSPPSLPNLSESPIQVVAAKPSTPTSLSPTNKYPPSAFNFGQPPSLLVPPRSARSRASTISSDDSESRPTYIKGSSRNRSSSINSEKDKDLTMRSQMTISSMILFNDIHGEEAREEALWKEREKARLNKMRAMQAKVDDEEEERSRSKSPSTQSQLPLRSQSAMSFNRCTSPAPTPPPREPLPLLPPQSSRLREEMRVKEESSLNAPGGALGFFDSYNFSSDVEEPDRSFSPASTTFGTSRISRASRPQSSSRRRYAGVDWDEAERSFSPSNDSPSRSRSSPDLRSLMEVERPDSAATWREASEATNVLSSLITRFEGSSRSPASSQGLPALDGTPKKSPFTATSTGRSRFASQNMESSPLRQLQNSTSAHSPAPTVSLTPEKWQHEEMLTAYSRRERDERRASRLTTGASIMTYESTEKSDSSQEYDDEDDLESLIEGVVGSDSGLPQEDEEETIASPPNALSSSNLLSVQRVYGEGGNSNRTSSSSMGLSSESGSAYSGFNWQPPHILVHGVLPNSSSSPIFDAVGQTSLPSSQPSTFREGGNSSLESPVLLRSNHGLLRRIGQISDVESSESSSPSSSESSSEGDGARLEVARDELSGISSTMDESPCPPPRGRRSQSRERAEVIEVSKSLNRALGQETNLGDAPSSSRQPFQPLSLNTDRHTPFVGLVALPSSSSAWQSVMKGPRGGRSTTPKSLFKDHLNKNLPPSPPSSADKSSTRAFGTCLLSEDLDTQTPPATVRILAPAFNDENQPTRKDRRLRGNSFLKSLETEESSYEVSPSKELLERRGRVSWNEDSFREGKSSNRNSFAPRITLTSESNEGHRDVDRPLSLGDSSFGEDEEVETEVEVKTARIESVATSRASTIFTRSQEDVSTSSASRGILVETVQESSWEEIEEGEQVEETNKAQGEYR